MKRKFLLSLIIIIFFLIIIPNKIYTQSNNLFSVSGKLIDSEKKLPIEFASIAIYKINDSIPITGTITNLKGEFILNNLSSGNYTLKSSFIGYSNNSKNIEIKNSSLNLTNPIVLEPSSYTLNEVQITDRQNEKQISIERTKINVAQNIASVTGNITDILKNQSSVSIDNDNNVYLRGNKNILILLDGVPTTMTSLNAIPGSNVESIEIITNPDAKYDAEGTGGIINIVTKKQNISGFSGAIIANYGFNNKINGGINLNYIIGMWNIGFNYNGKYEKADVSSNLERTLHTENIYINQNAKSTQENTIHTTNLFISAQPNNKNFISLNLKANFPEFLNFQHIFGEQTNSLSQTSYFYRDNDITFSRKMMESNLVYKRIFDKNKHEISFNTSFSKTKGNRPAKYYIENELLQKSFGGGAPQNIMFQIDYLRSVLTNGKIEAGLKTFKRWNTFNYSFFDFNVLQNNWIENLDFSNDLEHSEYIHSVYIMYSDSLLNKIYYKIGARFEYNSSELIQKSINEKIYNDYYFPFPFLLLKHDINNKQSISLSINRRVTRPIYPQINPFINIIDQMTYETGNKYLKPEILDKVEINHSLIYEKFQLRTNIYASKVNNFIAQVSLLSIPDKLVLTYVNGNYQNKIGGDIDFSYKFNKYISINPSMSLFYTKSTGKYESLDLSNNDYAWTASIKAIIKPEKKTEIQIFFNYNSPIDLPQFKLYEIYYTDISVKRSFLNNILSVSVTLSDIFNSRNWKIESNNSIYNLKNYSKSETRILWLGITYNFNSYKFNKSQKNTDNESENSVIKLGQ